MIGWIILAAYVVGYLGFTVVIARFIVNDMDVTADSEAIDKLMPVVLGMLLAVFWPLVIPGGYFYKKVWGGKR